MTGARVVAIDVQERTGEPTYFPFAPVAAWARAHKEAGAALARGQARVDAFTKGIERDQSRLTVTQILNGMNGASQSGQRQLHREFYNGVLAFGDRDDQPGAELAGRWFTRNAKIFAKLMQVARPGDRVIVVYGAGHKEWLSRLAEDTPGFRLEPTDGYLR